MTEIETLREILSASRRAVFFGGAGMSTESGIPDFRSAGGIYSETLHQEFSPEQMASHSFLMAHPAEFFDFYRRHCRNHADKKGPYLRRTFWSNIPPMMRTSARSAAPVMRSPRVTAETTSERSGTA